MRLFPILCLCIFISGCSGIQKSALNQRLYDLETRYKHHVGLSLYDPVKDKMLYEYNGTKYFTPASNTKILTFYTCLKTLPDSLITFFYTQRQDSLLLWPAGDPTFLNPEFPPSNVLDQLKNTDKDIYLSFAHANIEPFGPGWSWDDYPSVYSSERSALPLYGNYYSVGVNKPYLNITVPYFKNYFWLADTVENVDFIREPHSNVVVYYPGQKKASDTVNIPFQTSPWISASLLADTLRKSIYIIDSGMDEHALPLRSHPIDTAYKKMMHESNNFVAEQLLLQCSAVVFDSLDAEKMIDYSLQNYLSFLPQEPQWVDGSGLSRYNLITPNSVVALWDKILEEYPRERIFPLLATGGVSGTIKNFYKAPVPYIFGKTGTLSNNHVLSGFLITRSGKILVFSFMNNNYPGSSLPVKRQMEEILWEIHLNN